MKSHRILIFGLLLVVLCAGIPLSAGDVPLESVYKVVKRVGTQQELRNVTRRADEKLIMSDDGEHAYIVQSVPITSAGHLLSLMGGSAESDLTDAQRGLLETYRFSSSNQVNELKPMFPADKGKITLELNDLTGFEDAEKYPFIRNDFWPSNLKVTSSYGGNVTMESTIQMSGVSSQGLGTRTPTDMKTTFAHEFGHSLDLTNIEFGGYGPDGAHYPNEIIGERAAFAEGFANFVKIMMFPREEDQYRWTVNSLRREKKDGGYDSLRTDDPSLTGKMLLNVEAINALILTRMAKELGGGREAVLDAFSKSNATDNAMSRYLKSYVRLYPQSAAKVAEILDQETFGRLTGQEMRSIFGPSSGVENYLAKKNGTSPTGSGTGSSVVPTRPAPPPPRPGRIYKWIDADGRTHFTDTPPPNVEYKVMGTAREPIRVRTQESSANPFH